MPDYLTNLEPIGTITAPLLDIGVYDADSQIYQIFLTGNLSPLNGSLIDSGGLCVGNFSPVSAITMDDHTRSVSNIPDDATYFAWAYPLSGMDLVSDDVKRDLNPEAPEVSFVLFGGFLFFNDAYNLVQVNSVYGGTNINFSHPLKLRYIDIHNTLVKQGRLQAIHVQELKDKDITQFCWIMPNEKIGSQSIAPYGGFIYLYEDKTVQYFEILQAGEDQKLDPLLDNRVPLNMIQNCLRYMETEFEEEIEGLSKDEIIVKLTGKCKKFKEKLDEIQDLFACGQCLSNPQDMAFECGHMMCKECAKPIKECPMCRKPVGKKRQLFYV